MTAHEDSDNDLHLYHMMGFVAARDGNTDALAALLDAHPRVFSEHGHEFLLAACDEGQVACADLLITRGVPVNATDARGLSALDHAVIHHQWHMVPALLERDASPDGSQRGQRRGAATPLLLAARHGRDDIMGTLIEHGALAHYVDSRSENVLHYAARATENQREVIQLAKSVATPQMMIHKNCSGHEPMEVAIQGHNSAAIDALRQSEAHRQRRPRGLAANGRVPLQRPLFDDPHDGSKPRRSGHGR